LFHYATIKQKKQGKALQKILITSYFLLITFQRPKDFLGKSEEVTGKK